MTQDEIIEMAREAATEDGSVKRTDGKNVVIYAAKTNRFLERFAALVALAEREACAKVLDEMAKEAEAEQEPSGYIDYYRKKAAEIRARRTV